MTGASIYDRAFFEEQQRGSKLAASQMVPVICELFQPQSILDVGCGIGCWISEFTRAGVAVAHGIDGPWITREQLCVSAENFFPFDFEEAVTPFEIPLPFSRYDLLTTFEFVEHVPDWRAEALVEFFCAHSDVIVAGGAVPHQGGYNHVNEQWPSYWAQLFADQGYQAYDVLRPALWPLCGAEFWYAQNSIVYLKNGPTEEQRETIWRVLERSWRIPPAYVHPDLFFRYVLKPPERQEPILSHR